MFMDINKLIYNIQFSYLFEALQNNSQERQADEWMYRETH